MYAYTCKYNSQLMGTRDYTKFCIYYTNIMIKKFKQNNVVTGMHFKCIIKQPTVFCN